MAATTYIKDISITNGNNTTTYLIEPALFKVAATADSGATYTANDLTGFELISGAAVQIRFNTTNKDDATLSVNSTTAKPIYYNNTAITASTLKVNHIYTLVYDGSYWQIVGDIDSQGTVTKISTGAGLTGGDITTSGTIKAMLKSETKASTGVSAMGNTSSRYYAVGLDKDGYLAVNIPWANTAVTSAANHYAPSRNNNADISASADSATANWGIDVVTGVTAQTDGKGHITNLLVNSGKIPANPILGIELRDTDWNTLKTESIYYCPGDHGCTNTPSNFLSGGLRVTRIAAGFYKQEAFSTGGIWSHRIWSGTTSAWTDWKSYVMPASGTLALFSDIPTNLNQLTNGPGYVTSSGVTSVTIKAGAGITVSSSSAITTTGTRTISIKDMNTSTGATNLWLNQKGQWTTPSAADVGLPSALRFVGQTTSQMNNFTGIPAGINNYTTPMVGDVVLDGDGNGEYVCIAINTVNNTTTYVWELLGAESSFKLVQTAVTDPTASTDTSTTFIDSISQDEQGVITATKKTLPADIYVNVVAANSTLQQGYLLITTTSPNSTAEQTTTLNSNSLSVNSVNKGRFELILGNETNVSSNGGHYGQLSLSSPGSGGISLISSNSNTWYTATFQSKDGTVAYLDDITNAINDLDSSLPSGSGTGKTLTALTITDGKITSATFSNISITRSQISNFSHEHNYAGSSSAGGAATEVVTTANTTNDIYLVGVKNDATTTLLRNTEITMKGGVLTATTFSGDLSGNATTATTATNLSAAPTITKEGTADISLAAATVYTLSVGGQSIAFKTPSDANNVTQQRTSSTTEQRPLLFSYYKTSSADSSTARATYWNSDIYAIPSTGTIYATAFNGSLTGNVTGNLTGNVTGDVTGDVTGNLTGDVTGNLTGNVTGDVTGNADTATNATNDSDGNPINTTYVKVDGSNSMTGDLSIIAGDTDKFVNFWYNTNKTAGASWRIGMLGSGSSNTNYFVIQSGTSTTSATVWNNTIRIGQNNYDVALSGQLNISYAAGINSANGILNLTSSAAATVVKNGTWQHGINHVVTNLATGGHTCIATGKASETNKSAVICFNYNHASTLTQNTLGLGLFGNNNLLTIDGNGQVKISATTAATSTANTGALIVAGGIATGADSYLSKSVHIIGAAADNPLIVRGISGCDSTGDRGTTANATDQGLYLNYNGGPVQLGYSSDTSTNIVTVAYTQDASSSSTGAFVVNGGAGIAKKLYVGTGVYTPLIYATHTANASDGIRIYYSTTIDFFMGVGTGNTNHGLYDNKAGTSGKWILSSDATNVWNYDGNITQTSNSGNFARPIWFSHHDGTNVVLGKPGYNNNFTYNPSTRNLNFTDNATITVSTDKTLGVNTTTGALTVSSTTGALTIQSSTGAIKIQNTSTGGITLSSGNTLFINKPTNASIIFTSGGADTSHEKGRFNTNGMFQLATSVTQSTHKLLVNGDSAFNGRLGFITAAANTLTETAAIEYNTVGTCIDFRLGSSTNAAKTMKLDATAFYHATTNTGTLGTTTYKWKAIYVEAQSNANTEGLMFYTSTNLRGRIGTNTSGGLGIYGIDNIYIRTSLTDSTKGIQLTNTNLYPSTNNGISLGDTESEWNNTYSKKFIVEQEVTLQWNATDQSLDFIFA